MAPVRGLQIEIDKSQWKQLFDQLQKFAKKNGFESTPTDFNTDTEHFQLWMSRTDLIITADDVPPDSAFVAISFYSKYFSGPTSSKVLDDLIDDLKHFIDEIPNVEVAEEN